jgi:hypothetical protein
MVLGNDCSNVLKTRHEGHKKKFGYALFMGTIEKKKK